ncbi:Bidirectional sugar transporter sweet6a, partial [Thalictrum thalictroides]
QFTSAFLFLAPVTTIWKIYKRKDVEDFSPNPYLAGIMNCLMWIYYGLPLVTGNNILVIIINTFGLLMEILYVCIYLWYSKSNKQRMSVLWKVGVIAVVFALIVGFEMGFTHKGSTRLLAGGIQSTIFSICLYAMPLDIMRTVIKTRSVEYLPILLCIAGFLNGIDWSIYAFFSKTIDPFILIANGLGAILGAIQIILYLMYRNSTPIKDEKPTGQKQVEISSIDSIV